MLLSRLFSSLFSMLIKARSHAHTAGLLSQYRNDNSTQSEIALSLLYEHDASHMQLNCMPASKNRR